MASVNLPLHDALQRGTRLGWLASAGQHMRLSEAVLLVGCGVVAAVASQWLDFGLRIPGHAILRVVVPMGLGLALVPRRGAGTVMGISALLSGLIIGVVRVPGGGLSLGALTSLALTGPLLDVSLRKVQAGWRLYIAFAFAGLSSNVAALLVRGGTKALGLEGLKARPLWEWLPQASASYLICGLLAGLISGFIWFHGRQRLAGDKPS